MNRILGVLLVACGLILLPVVTGGALTPAHTASAASGPSLTSEIFQPSTLTMTNNSATGGSACPSQSATPTLTICRPDQAQGGSTCDTIANSPSTFNFAATGTAKGPVNGNYTVNGTFVLTYDASNNPTVSNFSANFQISSGGGTAASGALGIQAVDQQNTSNPDGISGYCNGFGVPVINALVTYYNAQVNGSGVTGQTDLQLTGTAGTAGPSSDGFTQAFNWTATTGVCYTSIDTTFNGTSIPANSTLWAPAVIKLQGPQPTSPVTISFNSQTLTFPGGSTYTIPNGTLIVSPSATTSTTTYSNGSWQTTVPAGYAGNTFAAGVAIPLPSGLAGGAKPVTWSAQISSSQPGYTVHWQWSAAAYSSAFDSTYQTENISPTDGAYRAGTPQGYLSSLIGGGTGVGGSSYTGSPSDTAHCRF